MFPFAGRSISPQTERKDVSRETFSLSIRGEILTLMPQMADLSDLRLTRPSRWNRALTRSRKVSSTRSARPTYSLWEV
jgi:hypothetical protein